MGNRTGATANRSHHGADYEEDIVLLAAGPDNDDDAGVSDRTEDDGDGVIVQPRAATATAAAAATSTTENQERTPRTPNRVRFDLRPTVADGRPAAAAEEVATNGSAYHHARGSLDDAGDEDPLDPHGRHRRPDNYDDDDDDDDDDDVDVDVETGHSGRQQQQQRVPLLTDIQAPSVALANSPWEGDDDDDDTHERAEAERRRPKSGLRSAFMNMANSIIGAGIIGQPYAFRQAGLLSGIVLLVALTFVVDWTICLIVINSKLSGANSFQGTVEHCFGRGGLIAISVAQWAFAFGGMIAFGIIVGDSIPHVLLAVWPGLREVPVLGLLADRRVAIAVFVLGISYPLTLYRDIAKLAKASTLALVSMFIIVLTVLIQGVLTPKEQRGTLDSSHLIINDGIFQAVGVISFAFVCHHNSLLIYGSIKTPTIDRFSTLTHYSTGVSMVACLVMAASGFLVFGDKTLGNVLNNFPADNTMVNVARLCFGLNMLTTLPLEAFVCREVMLNYYFPGAPFDLKLHVVFSTALVVGAMAISLITCDLGSVFELVGTTSACAMAYILPPMCYIKLATRSWKTYMAMGVVVFGCAVMVISLFQSISKIIRGDAAPAQCM